MASQKLWNRLRTIPIVRDSNSLNGIRSTIFLFTSTNIISLVFCSNGMMEFYQLTAGRVLKSVWKLAIGNHTDSRPRKHLNQRETSASENICKLPVRKLEQNIWSLIAVLYNHTIKESLVIKWKLHEVKAKRPSENVCKLPVRKLEQNTWSLIAVLYNHPVEESLAIKWKLDEVKAKQAHRRTYAKLPVRELKQNTLSLSCYV